MVGPVDACSPRLRVRGVRQSQDELCLQCVVERGSEEIHIVLREAWALTEPAPQADDIVRVLLCTASFDFVRWTGNSHFVESAPLIVDDKSNIFILSPDTLVSSTAVADSFACLRKAVLASRFPRGVAGSAMSPAALSGSMIHDLFQAIITNSGIVSSVDDGDNVDIFSLSAAVEDVVANHIQDIYAADMHETQARKLLMSSVPGILSWATTFLGPRANAPVTDSRKIRHVAVPAVHDIEELVWSPIFGLKGKFDASVELRNAESPTASACIAPLELKTGSSRGNAGISHYAQVVLYTLLMSDRYGMSVKRGLLSYIRISQLANGVSSESVGQETMSASQATRKFKNERGELLSKRPRLDIRKTAEDYETGTTRDSIVNVVRDELVGIVMQRNKLARFVKVDAEVKLLPPMVSGIPAMCEKCFCLDSCMAQHKLLEHGTAESAESDGPGAELFCRKTDHLQNTVADYYSYWQTVLVAEEAHASAGRSELWAVPASEKQAAGSCWTGLYMKPPKFDSSTTSQAENEAQTFSPSRNRLPFVFYIPNDASVAERYILSSSCISVGDFVVVSVQRFDALERHNRDSVRAPAVATGFVETLTESEVRVKADRDLWEWSCRMHSSPDTIVWRIDAEEISASFNTAKANVESLFVLDEAGNSEKLRSLIVELRRPCFGRLPEHDQAFLEKFCKDISNKGMNVNAEQRRALQMSVQAQDYLLILGMPGTGKTATLAAIVLAAVKRRRTVLLCSHTRAAVDNALSRLLDLDFTDFVRVGQRSHVSDSRLDAHYVGSDTCSAVKDLADRLEKPAVVATTCLGINHAVFAKRHKYDIVIVDEASQILQPICVGPLRFSASAFILVGDHYQLPPLMKSASGRGIEEMKQVPKATNRPGSSQQFPGRIQGSEVQDEDLPGSESLFRRLCDAHPHAVVSLVKQYRMANEIMELSNTLVYHGQMTCGSSDVGRQMLNTALGNTSKYAKWLKAVVNPTRRILFLSTSGNKTAMNESTPNGIDIPSRSSISPGDYARRSVKEANIITKAISALTANGLCMKDIAVLTPYRAQVAVLRAALKKLGENKSLLPETSTIDQYQGKDKACIFFSLVVNDDSGQIGPLLQDWRRVNVAITRARSKLVMVGSAAALKHGGSFLQSLINIIHAKNAVIPVEE